MKRNYRTYTDDDIIKASSEVKSMAGLLKKLGLKAAGGNYIHMKKQLKRLNLECSHWTGMLWSKGERLKNWDDYTKIEHCKKHLIKDRGHTCEGCSLTEWMKNIIPLEVHHLDGDRTNNTYLNLLLLCPNCHALTENWRRKKQ